MPVPKGKTSKARTRSRRANHDRVSAPTTTWCQNCGAQKLPHHVCMSCGTYRGRQLIKIVEG